MLYNLYKLYIKGASGMKRPLSDIKIFIQRAFYCHPVTTELSGPFLSFSPQSSTYSIAYNKI